MLKDQTTLKGVIAGATFARLDAHLREQFKAGKGHGETLDAIVSAGLDAAGGAAAPAKPARASAKKKS